MSDVLVYMIVNPAITIVDNYRICEKASLFIPKLI
jgi:hypothetical protein